MLATVIMTPHRMSNTGLVNCENAIWNAPMAKAAPQMIQLRSPSCCFAAEPIAVSSSILQNHLRRLLGDHDDGGVGVARDEIRHDRSVDHPQAFDAANPKP